MNTTFITRKRISFFSVFLFLLSSVPHSISAADLFRNNDFYLLGHTSLTAKPLKEKIKKVVTFNPEATVKRKEIYRLINLHAPDQPKRIIDGNIQWDKSSLIGVIRQAIKSKGGNQSYKVNLYATKFKKGKEIAIEEEKKTATLTLLSKDFYKNPQTKKQSTFLIFSVNNTSARVQIAVHPKKIYPHRKGYQTIFVTDDSKFPFRKPDHEEAVRELNAMYATRDVFRAHKQKGGTEPQSYELNMVFTSFNTFVTDVQKEMNKGPKTTEEKNQVDAKMESIVQFKGKFTGPLRKTYVEQVFQKTFDHTDRRKVKTDRGLKRSVIPWEEYEKNTNIKVEDDQEELVLESSYATSSKKYKFFIEAQEDVGKRGKKTTLYDLEDESMPLVHEGGIQYEGKIWGHKKLLNLMKSQIDSGDFTLSLSSNKEEAKQAKKRKKLGQSRYALKSEIVVKQKNMDINRDIVELDSKPQPVLFEGHQGEREMLYYFKLQHKASGRILGPKEKYLRVVAIPTPLLQNRNYSFQYSEYKSQEETPKHFMHRYHQDEIRKYFLAAIAKYQRKARSKMSKTYKYIFQDQAESNTRIYELDINIKGGNEISMYETETILKNDNLIAEETTRKILFQADDLPGNGSLKKGVIYVFVGLSSASVAAGLRELGYTKRESPASKLNKYKKEREKRLKTQAKKLKKKKKGKNKNIKINNRKKVTNKP